MKRILFLSAVLLLMFSACTQRTETVTTTDEGQTSTVSTTTPAIDEEAVSDAAQSTEDAARDAAAATGTAMETAGQELQEEAKPDQP